MLTGWSLQWKLYLLYATTSNYTFIYYIEDHVNRKVRMFVKKKIWNIF